MSIVCSLKQYKPCEDTDESDDLTGTKIPFLFLACQIKQGEGECCEWQQSSIFSKFKFRLQHTVCF